MEHVRGETDGASPGIDGVTPDREVGERAREGHPVVFVLDKHGAPLQPATPARARKLLRQGRAVVARHTPFVIRLKDRTAGQSQVDGVELGIDPGAKHTGIAVFTARDGERRGLYAVELAHRGGRIRDKLTARAAYRRGTLRGTEVREYLLAKWGRSCAYCGATGVPLDIDHIHPRSRGGSDRVSNLCTACIPCNEKKSKQPVEHFLKRSPRRLARILAQAKAPLRDAAAVNATRWALWHALDAAFPTVRTASGGRTKWNRQRTGTPKTHTLDALCAGELYILTRTPGHVLAVTATGRGTYTRTCPDKYGFPRLRLPRQKQFFGYQTGDLARAVVPTGKKAGTHTGRIAVRATGRFNIKTAHGLIQGIGHKHFRLLQRADGYAYTTRPEGPTGTT
ncbi:RNA-guided endonuclease IscB [Streptomyces sp. H34-S4]|uniref:RNA-guided endonuclease IscB n=1 Tax=Streptomyces sp. H34-S4 TaxID=2996463 RepID=UPI00226E2B96|nr:RNA-guided endonuclease IscB [Streptomyces sp. H34-S4]MCY0937935.1 RNA-guided endonuclease IscB [Streptomyces sp. H34-S4]